MATTSGTEEEQARERYRRLLRLFLNDTPELNRLIRQHESSDEKLDLCIDLVVSDYNTTSPLIGEVRVVNFPSLYLMMYGGAIHALRSAGLLQSRNELAYSSGGVSVRIFDKTQYYQSWIQQFIADYERKKSEFKVSANISSALAGCGVYSEYSLLNYFW